MKHAFRKVLAMLLVVVMIIGVVPSVFAAGAGYVEPFRDVKETDWFADAVKFVYNHDPQLMNGMTPITFEPQANCTRAMTAVVLYRMKDPAVPAVNESKFVDLTADWYKNAVVWAEQNEIVKGVDEKHFNPDGLVTREQLVTMIWRAAGEPQIDRDYLKDFSDAKQVAAYAKDAFNWAIGAGIINGRKIVENNKTRVELAPQGNATRAEMAKILMVACTVMDPCKEDKDHLWDDGIVTVKPTCENAGEMLYTCKKCGETKTEAIPALGHNYVDGVCTVCKEKIAEADEIVIYYTNDVHTYIDGALSYDTIADLKNQTEKVAAGVLLVDAGDHIQGTAYGAMDKGKHIIELMNAAGYDLATLGNHEFDYGMEGAMNAVRWAQFPYVSANFYHEKNGVKGANVLDSYKMFDIDGKKIAIIGITTPESFTKSTPAYFQDEEGNYIYGIAGGVTGKELYDTVQSAITAAKGAGADYIIALGHLGDDVSSKPWTSEDLIANTTGLNAFIDGHSHSTVEQKYVQDAGKNKVVLTQTGSYFGAIGKLTIDKKGTISTELITSFNGSNSAVAALKNEWINTVDGMLGKVIGHTSLTFDNYENGTRLVRKEETNTGDFAADALYYLFDNMGLDVDVAIMNGGGVRNKAITGDITYKTCKDIHTFGNVACLQTITGQQLLDALEWGARDVGSAECGGFLQVSGITYDIYTNIKSTVRKDDKGVWTGGPTGDYRVTNVKIWDKEAGKYVPLDKKATYNLAGYNYTLRDLGDGFAMFNGAVNVLDYVMEDYMVLANYVEAFAPVNGKPEVVANSTLVPFGSDYSTVHGSGRIKIFTSGKPVDEENIFTLATSIADGDEVIIYSPGHKMAIKNENDNNWYLVPEPVEPTGNQFVDPSEDIVWKVRKNADGSVKFTNGINEITCWVSGNYFELTNVADYEGADGNWIVTWTNGLAYIQHATFANSYGPAYIECFYNASKDKTNISGYSSSNPTAKSSDFGFQFFVKGAGGSVTPTEPTTGPTEPTTGPVTAEFALASSIKGGDEVVIYSPGHQMAIKDENDNNWYLVPQAVTVSDNKIVSPDASIVWKVVDNGDGSFSFTNGSDMIVCWVSGNYFELTNDPNYAGADGKWKIDYSGDLAYIKHASFSNSYGPAYIECYYNASKDKTNVSGYSSSDPTAKSNDFGWQFYVKGAAVTPTTAPTEPTSGPTEPTTAPSGDFVLSSSIKGGDKVVIYSPGHQMAIKDENDNNWYLVPQAVTVSGDKIAAPDAAIVWTVVDNGDGTFSFTNGSDAIVMWVSGNYFELTNDPNYAGADGNWKVSWTDGLAYIQHATFSNSYGPAYIECYYNSSKDKTNVSGYSSSDPTAKSNDFGWQFFVQGGSTTPTTAPTEPTTAPTEPTTAPSGDFVLSSSIKGGDKVVIYSPGHQMAIKDENDNNWYLVPQAVTVSGDKIAAPDAAIVWTVVDNGDGTFSFTNGSDAIVMWVSGNYFELTNDPNYSGANGKWKVSWTDGLAYIQHATFSNSYGPAYIECYYNSSKDKTNVSGYSSSDPTAKSNDFGWQFFVQGGSTTPTTAPTEPTSAPTEPTTAPSGDYVLASSIKGGDEVVIYSPGHGMAIKNENDNNWYLKPQAVTPSNSVIAAPDASIVWKVVDNGDGTFSFTNGSNAIVMWVSGNYFELTNDPNYSGANGKWKVSWTDGLAYIQHASFSNSYGPAYIECYYNANKDVTNVSGYSSSDPTAKSADFGWQFYVKGGSVTPTTPTTAPTEPTTAPTEPTTAPGGDSFVLADSIAVGDKIVFVAAHNGTNYAMTNSTAISNALGAEVVTVNGDTVDVSTKRAAGSEAVWEVCAGSASGKYTLKSSDGKFISWGGSGTGLSLTGTGYDLTVTCGKGASKLLVETDRGISFRNNAGSPQFRAYKDSNNSGEYSWDLTIYKLGGGSVTPTTAPTEPTTAPTEPTTAPGGDEFSLTTSLKDGDQVIIYNASAKKAMSEDAVSTNYRAGADVTVSNNKIVTSDSKIIWTVKASGSGFIFSNDAGETLSATKGLSFAATDNVWAINPATTANSVYIVSTTATGTSGDPKYVEWYSNYSEFSTYYYSEANEAIFAMQLFVKTGSVTPTEPTTAPTQPTTAPTEPTTAPTQPTTAPGGNEYVLTTSLKDGDEVVIYNAGAGMAMSEDAVSTNYRAGVAVTPSGNKIVTDDSKIVWSVKASGDGFIFSNDAGETLSATKGLSFATTDNVWAINAATTANSVYIVSTTATGTSGDPKSIEWYDKYTEFSTYYYSEASEAIFAMQLFVKSGSVAPTEPTTAPTEPTTAPTEPTTAPTEPTTAPTEPTTAPTEPTVIPGGEYFTVADSLKAGDKIVLVAEYNGKYYAMTNDASSISNALAAEEVTVSDDMVDVSTKRSAGSEAIWTLASGSEAGTFLLKSADGKYITWTSGTTIKLNDTGVNFKLTCGKGTSSALLASDASRGLLFRDNGGALQFRAYAQSNITSSGYSGVLTIFKLTQSVAPTEPTTAPTEPTTAPTEPTTAPTEPTTAPTEPTTAPAGLPFEDGDCVVIYNAAAGVIIGYEEDSDYDQSTGNYTYCNITTEAVTVSGTSLTADFENAGTFYVSINDDGTVYFVDQYDYDQSEDPENPDVYLLAAEAPDTYYDMYTDYAAFEIIAVDGGYLLKNVADESYYCVENGVIVAKSLIEGDRSFIFQFAIWEGDSDENNNIICTLSGGSVNPTQPTSAPTEPTSAPTEPTAAPTEPTTAPAENEYVLTTSLKDGDEVIIYNASAKKAMSEDAISTNYRAGVDVTVTDDAIVTDDSKIVWTVKTSGSGYTFSNDAGETLSATKGLSFATTDNVWAINAAKTADSVYIVSTTATGTSGDPKSIEWYDKYTEFSTYYYSEASEAIFAMQLFVKSGSVTPTEPTTAPTEPTTAPTEPTTAPTEPTTAPTEPTTAPTEPTTAPGEGGFIVADSLKAGDKIVLAAEYNGKYYAMTNDTSSISNALAAEEVTVSGGAVDVKRSAGSETVWELAAGSTAGTFLLKSSDGKYIAWTSGTTIKLNDTGVDFNLTCGNGTSSALLASDASRGLLFRDNGGALQFRAYSQSNATASGYSAVLTIFKYAEGGTTPTEPTTAPTEPTTAPTEPTTAPTEPTTAPTEPTTAPTEPTTAPTEPTTAPEENEYVLTMSLTDGDQVIIYNASAKKAMSEDAVSTNYRAGVDVTVTDDAIVTADSKIVWDVEQTENGYIFSNDAGETLSATKGLSFASTDNVWAIKEAKTADSVYIVSTTATGTSGDPKTIEWYDRYTEFSTYYYSEASEAIFALQLFVKSGSVTPTEPTTAPTEPTTAPTEPTTAPTEPTTAPTEPTTAPTEPTTAPTEPTTAPTEPTTAPTEPTTAPTEPTEAPTEPTEAPTEPTEAPTEPTTAPGEGGFVVADSLKEGDKIVLVAEYDGKYYAMTNDNSSISNALAAEEVSVSGGAVDVKRSAGSEVVWELVAGTEAGTFQIKSSDGKYIAWASSTSLRLLDTGIDFTVTCGAGDASILVTSTLSASTIRGLIFRDNGGALQFRAYSQSNASTNGYSAVLTIFKYAEGGETPTEPTTAPTEPTTAPTEPTEAPTEPTVAPTEPTEAPTEPTVAPTEPTVAPTEPTVAPTEPTEAPTEPTVAPTEPTEPVTGDMGYFVADSLKAGDKIVFVAEFDGAYYAMANDTSITNALVAAAITVSGKQAVIGDADVVWEVVAGSAAGTYTLKNKDGKFINWTSSTSIKLADAGVNFNLTCGEGTSKALIASDNSRGLLFRDNGGALQFRAYSQSNATGNGYSGVLTIYKYTEGGTAPTEPTTAPTEPTTAPTEPTEAPTEPTEAPTEPTTAPTEPSGEGGYVVADSVKVGDKIVIVAEYSEKFYAMKNDTSVSNALGATEVTVASGKVTFGEADVVWEVVAGSATGTFLLRNKDGKYIHWTSGTTVKLSDTGANFTITCGSGTSSLLVDASRGLLFRDNGGVPQFRAYATSNATTSGYSGVLTIFKLS